jgi:hypothetical protein
MLWGRGHGCARCWAQAPSGQGVTGWRQVWSREGEFYKTNPFPIGDARSHQAPRRSAAAEDLPEGRVLGVTAGRFLQNEPISAAGWEARQQRASVGRWAVKGSQAGAGREGGWASLQNEPIWAGPPGRERARSPGRRRKDPARGSAPAPGRVAGFCKTNPFRCWALPFLRPEGGALGGLVARFLQNEPICPASAARSAAGEQPWAWRPGWRRSWPRTTAWTPAGSGPREAPPGPSPHLPDVAVVQAELGRVGLSQGLGSHAQAVLAARLGPVHVLGRLPLHPEEMHMAARDTDFVRALLLLLAEGDPGSGAGC